MPGWPLHLLQCLLVAVVIVAPLPLALALVRRYGSADHERLENLLATTVFSITVQLVLGLTLGLLGFLNPGAVIVASALVLAVGGCKDKPKPAAQAAPVVVPEAVKKEVAAAITEDNADEAAAALEKEIEADLKSLD